MLLENTTQQSEVARILGQIRAEYESAQRGLTGLSYGTSRHEFITARMETMGGLHAQLHDIVGDAAIALLADQLDACSASMKVESPINQVHR